MRFKAPLLTILLVTSLGGISSFPTQAADFGIYFNKAPPPLRHERHPGSRRGHHWVAGHWEARHGRHVWRRGYWQRNRTGYHYIAPRWNQRGEKWSMQRGRWNRDSDGDGVPDRRDNRPNNPYRQ